MSNPLHIVTHKSGLLLEVVRIEGKKLVCLVLEADLSRKVLKCGYNLHELVEVLIINCKRMEA